MPDVEADSGVSVHLLGHRHYTVALTPAGVGCSRWKGLAITRWHAGDSNEQGGYVYLRDVANGNVWSATARPCGGTVRHWFDGSMARFARRDGAITTTLEVAVDPERAVEVRGIGVRNDGSVERLIELTSYAELVLAPVRDDASHPAYAKMFVQTAFEDGVLLAWRRKKDPSEPDIWVAHALVVDGAEAGKRECETDRARFIGRDGLLAAPAAARSALSDTAGTVLDPVFSLRTRVKVTAGATRRAAFVIAAAASRDEVLALIRQYLSPVACAGLFARVCIDAAQAMQEEGFDERSVHAFGSLAGALTGVDASLRADPAVAAKGEGGAPVLWAKGISGDLPIVLARVANAAGVELVADLVRAQRYLRARQLPADLVVLDASAGGDMAATAAALQSLRDADAAGDKSQGALFVLREAELDARLRAGLHAVASITLDGANGDLAAQLEGHACAKGVVTFTPPPGSRARGGQPAAMPKPADLDHWNGVGGFGQDGREFVTILRDGMHTPAPWSHIIANPDFGFLVTATGGGYAWAINSQQNQITSWSNDPVCDPPAQVFLLRDRDDGTEWSAAASPLRAGGAAYVARFGPGYARFDANVHGIETELTQCVAASDPVQLSRLRLRNCSGRMRHIAVAQAVTWCLGAIGSEPRTTTFSDADSSRAAVFARNAWRDEFAQATAFITCGAEAVACGSEAGRSAVVAQVDLAPGASIDVLFLLGEGVNLANAQTLVDRYRKFDFKAALGETRAVWGSVLEPLQVETPQHSLDLLVNRCLPYQVLACRLWARTAFYQASGAFGFRDQLQDVGALCIARPDLVRQHILLSASRQFEEGDVQHWWLPPSGKGVRTRIVDDRLWLPYIVAHYVITTGDTAILDEQVSFVHGDALQPGQTDSFFAPGKTTTSATLFEHCARAIDVSLANGVHGLPLMGTGDWNDGMNRVGAGGKGESVWMGWFLCRVVADFEAFADARRDPRASNWRDHVRALQLALETKAWDGAWYLRAYYDDGTPLGSVADSECRVESMAQSWAVISEAGDPERAQQAMQAVNQYLVRPHDGVVALFTEPFDQTAHDPGYIKGYPPGLRENGGQYTHGCIWSLIAYAMLGEGDKAGELLEIFDPIRKSDSPEKVARYKVEPYVECADVYAVAPHAGRGGWTWYSGSAGWLYRAIVEWVLGFRLRGDRLALDPCIPHRWKGFALRFLHRTSTYRIEVENPGRVCRGIASIEVDGVTLQDSNAGIALVDDGTAHHVRVTMHKEPH
jgi:cyclic beta-1,2-glucan synthetase